MVENLLPYDGEAYYFGSIFDQGQASDYYTELLDTIRWTNDELVLFGRQIITRRKVAWYGREPYAYTYSRSTKHALPWTSALEQIRAAVETSCGEKFNACLLNLYHSGDEGMGWHSDDEKELVPEAAIASVSFGAARRFDFRHKVTRQVVSVVLESGSLLVMKGSTQKHWQHRLAPRKRIVEGRINLTFRAMAPQKIDSTSYNL